MSELDHWAREHRHRIKRDQIAKIRTSRGGMWSGLLVSGAIGMTHLASGHVVQQQNSGLFPGFGVCSGAIAGGAIASGGISSKGTPMPAPIDWSKIYGAIGAG